MIPDHPEGRGELADVLAQPVGRRAVEGGPGGLEVRADPPRRHPHLVHVLDIASAPAAVLVGAQVPDRFAEYSPHGVGDVRRDQAGAARRRKRRRDTRRAVEMGDGAVDVGLRPGVRPRVARRRRHHQHGPVGGGRGGGCGAVAPSATRAGRHAAVRRWDGEEVLVHHRSRTRLRASARSGGHAGDYSPTAPRQGTDAPRRTPARPPLDRRAAPPGGVTARAASRSGRPTSRCGAPPRRRRTASSAGTAARQPRTARVPSRRVRRRRRAGSASCPR